jgi:uncharacterized protein YajQ (UPF0234 family)
MSSAQGKRIQANRKIIWGDSDYEFDVETEDSMKYWGFVKKDFGFFFGPPLTMTALCNSRENAWNELDRMLDVWARQGQSGEPMTKNQRLEIFGGPNGRNKAVLEMFMAELEKRETSQKEMQVEKENQAEN